MAERGLTLAQVRDAVRARNRDTSGGDLDAGKRRYLLRTVGRVRDVASLEELVVASRGDTLVRLRDIATVQLDHFERRELSFNNGKPALSLSIRREPGSNVIAIKRAMLPAVEDINRDLLDHGIWTNDDYRTFYNVNFPPLPAADVKGTKVAAQGYRRNTNFSMEAQLSPTGRKFLWVKGGAQHEPTAPGTDAAVNLEGYISVTPMRADLTAHDVLADLEAKLG